MTTTTQAKSNVSYSDMVAVAKYTIRKMIYLHKEMSYFPILFETELSDFLTRREYQ